jgi:drug/metabolite transporter (DMT)-like permease
MSAKHIVLCLIFALCLPIGQVLFKLAAVTAQQAPGSLLMRMVANGPLYGAFAVYAGTALLWYYILMEVPLSRAYVFSILGSAFVPLFAWLFFSEPMTTKFIIGCAIMLIGFYIAVAA